MPFPESPREIYEQNTIKEVIAQLRFPTILQVAAEPPAQFQNRVRGSYPLYQLESPIEALPKELGDLASLLPIKQNLAPVHKFLKEDESRFISLSPEFMALSEKRYTRWEEFRQELQHTESALLELYGPTFYSRIGLRYQDVIDKEQLGLATTPWAELLHPFLIGPLGDPQLAQEVAGLRTEWVLHITEVPGALVRIRHGLQLAPETPDAYVIDMDLFTSERSSTDETFGILDIFNRVAGRVFRWAITGDLRAALGPSSRPESK